jgi:hypothetical protein
LVIVVRRCGRGGAEPRTWLSPSGACFLLAVLIAGTVTV